MCTRIIGTGSYIPKKVITNDDLSLTLDTSDAWISTRTGIHNRHIAEGMTSSDMAYMAARRAVDDSGLNPADIDVIIVATSSPDYAFPSTAALVQAKLEAVNAACFDISAACTGFIYAYSIAQGYIAGGMYKNILIIGTEVMSEHVDWKDRSVCVLFGDGAGAAMLTADKDNLSSVMIHSDGSRGNVLTCGKDNIFMDGQEVFKFAVKTVPMSIQDILNKEHIRADDVGMYILHQANQRIIQAVSKRLGISMEKFPMNMQEYGNTSAASIPILLDELNRNNRLVRDELIVMSGFGAGLSWGSIVLNW
jgi:3-oxoacyl-[acyl-carrier-protein] synthase-3